MTPKHRLLFVVKLRRSFLACGLLFVFFALAVQSLFAAGLPQGDPEAAGFSKALLGRIDFAIRRVVEKQQIAGAAAIVATDGKIVYRANLGLRDVENNLPITDDTIYRIASMTKPITSVAVMMLVEDGKLKLDDSLAKFVPEFGKARVIVAARQNGKPAGEDFEALKRPITIRHLLTHTSGITYGFFGREPVAEHFIQAEVFDGLAEAPGTMATTSSGWRACRCCFIRVKSGSMDLTQTCLVEWWRSRPVRRSISTLMSASSSRWR
jgi:CubicO group peptidase (beta-lactamase class C family)